MCETENFSFLSADGIHQIQCRLWLPACPPRGVVQIVHGVAEHMGRYEDTARFLTGHGFAVCGEDHLGHGRTASDGKYGYFGPKNGWSLLVRDIAQLRQRMGRRFPRIPYFILGHSMGSFLARTYLIRYPGAVDAAVIMGTGQMSPAIIAGGKAVAAEEARRIGEDQTSSLVDKLAFGAYNKRFAPNRTGFDWLSLNQDNVDRYIADPLCGGNATIGLFREMLGGLSFIASLQNLKRMNLNIPVLFISGEMDPVGDCGKGVQRAYESFRKAGVRDVSLKLYPELRHEILNEACRETVYGDIYQWLAAKVPISV